MITPKQIDQARDTAETAIAEALNEGRKPHFTDLILLHLLEPKPRLGQRIRNAAFPLVVVLVALVMTLAAIFLHPPASNVSGQIRTTQFGIDLVQVLEPNGIQIRLADTDALVTAFGYSGATPEDCAPPLDGAAKFEAIRVTLGLSGAARLAGAMIPTNTAPGRDDPRAILEFQTDSAMVLELAQPKITRPPGKARCAGIALARLTPAAPNDAHIVAGPLAHSVLPAALTLPRAIVSGASFTHVDPGSAVEHCAIEAANLRIVQRIGVVGIERERSVTLTGRTCLDLSRDSNNTWTVRLSALADTFLVNFEGTALPRIDDGKSETALLSSYFEIITEDPTIAMIFGATVFLLTTLWGVAAFIKEIWK